MKKMFTLSIHQVIAIFIQVLICFPALSQLSASNRTNEIQSMRMYQEKINLRQCLHLLEQKYAVAIAYKTDILDNLQVEYNWAAEKISPEAELKILLKGTDYSFKKADDNFFIIYNKKEKQIINQETKEVPENENSSLLKSPKKEEVTVTGTVTGVKGESLPGVNILVKGTNFGTVSDINGRYLIKVPDLEQILVFSYVGYESMEVAINGRSTIDVELTPDIETLKEIVVTALGVERDERALGYGVQEVDPKNIDKAQEVNIVNSLAGRVSGVQVQGSSNLGGSSRILIRGVNSVQGENQPLFIIDGTPVNNASFNTENQDEGNTGRDYGNTIQDLNPNDIASISVLKGPSASALYGSRGANGVILITTKKGKKQQGLGVEINSSTMFSRPMRYVQYQDEYGGGLGQFFMEFGGIESIAPYATGSWGPRMEGQMVRHWDSFFPDTPEFEETRPYNPNPGNVKDFFETGLLQSSNFAITGGNETTTFRLSYNNTYQKGILDNSELIRNNFSFNGSHDLSDKLTASVNLNYINSDVTGRPPTGEFNVNNSAPSVGFYLYGWHNRQWDFNRMRDYSTPNFPDKSILFLTFGSAVNETALSIANAPNPYFTLNKSFSEDERTRIFGNFSLNYQVNEFLSLQGFVRTDFYSNIILDRNNSPYRPPLNSFSKSVSNYQENNYEFLGTFNKKISSEFSLLVNLGANQRVQTLNNSSAATNNGLSVPEYYNLAASNEPLIANDFRSKKIVNSLYGVANLGFKETLFLESSLRNDWSSTLPAGNNSFLYPSVSTSLVFSELLPSSNFFSFGKLRAGWALVGNDTDPYRLNRIYVASQPYGDQTRFRLPGQANNPDLEPEFTESYEVGIDLRFINNRLNLDLTYYDSKTTNQIIPLNITGATGFSSVITNAGVMSNRGFELQLGSSVISTSKFNWDVFLNLSRNINELEELSEQSSSLLLASNQGVNLVAEAGKPYGTFYGSSYVRDEAGNKLVDDDGFYLQGPQAPIGNLQPDFLGGLSNTVSFAGISISALIDFQKGGDFYSVSLRDAFAAGNTEETVGNNQLGNPKRDPVNDGGGVLADGVLENGNPNTTYVNAQEYYGDLVGLREEWIFDASFIKLREVTVGYNLPDKLFSNLNIQSIYFGFVARNLGLLYSSQPHIDPSQISLGSGNIQGYDVFNLPSQRSMGFNVNIKF